MAGAALFAQGNVPELEKYSEQGEHALAEHRYAEAEQAYERLRQLSPGTAEVYGRLGLIYFQEGKFGEAVPVLRRALELKPGLPNTDVLLAMSLSELGEFEKAVPNLEKGFKRTPDLPLKRMSGLQLLRAYTGLHRDSKAVELALELNRQFPNDPEVLYHASRVYANFAYITLQKLSEVAPASLWRQLAAAEADESQGNLEQAVTEYRSVLAIDPRRHGIHYRIGRAMLSGTRGGQSGSQSEALQEFEQELQLDPTNANAAYEAGEIHRKAGQLEKAQEFFGRALESYPDFEEALVGLGGVEIAVGKPELAIGHLLKAVGLDARDEVIYYRLSQAYKALGRTVEQQKALASFRRLHEESESKRASGAEVVGPREVTRQSVDAAAPQ